MRTSRGFLQEAQSIVGNLLASENHLFDIKDEESLHLSRIIRFARNKTLKLYAKKDDINLDYHCVYKHILLAKTQTDELVQSFIGEKKDLDKLVEIQCTMNELLLEVTIKYLNINKDAIDNKNCWRCIEDFMENREKI